jgi:CheY-like chemotaxis protein/HPt (histidine-containing phosphotransfer) domain-containing protein
MNDDPLLLGSLVSWVRLVLGREESDDERAVASRYAPTALNIESARADGCLVLLVEDNPVNRDVASRQLARLGYTCVLASSGSEALEKLQEGGVGLVLSDLHMPELDGFALARKIRAGERNGGHLPLLAYTAAVLPAELERCRESGFDDVLVKPAVLEDLRAALNRWMPRASNDGAPPATLLSEEALRRHVGDDPATCHAVLQEFSHSSENLARELHALARERDEAAIAEIAHQLKSSARTIGAVALADLSEALEHDIRVGRTIVLSDRVQALLTAHAQVLQEIAVRGAPGGASNSADCMEETLS